MCTLFKVERLYVCLYVFIPAWLWTAFLSDCSKFSSMFDRKWLSSISGKETPMFENGLSLFQFGSKTLHVLFSKSAIWNFLSFRVRGVKSFYLEKCDKNRYQMGKKISLALKRGILPQFRLKILCALFLKSARKEFPKFPAIKGHCKKTKKNILIF